MSRHPAPDAATAHAAAAAIVDRRTAAPCPHLHLLDDSLTGVVAHVARHGDTQQPTRDVDPDLVRADVVDALAVLDYLDEQHRQRSARWRLGLIAAARRAHMGPTDLMGPLHQRHRQGVAELVDRLRATLDPTVRVADARAGRAAAADTTRTRAAATDASATIRTLARELLALGDADLLPDDEWLAERAGVDLDDLAAMLDRPDVAPIASALRLLANAIRHAPDLDDRVRAVVDEIDALGVRR